MRLLYFLFALTLLVPIPAFAQVKKTKTAPPKTVKQRPETVKQRPAKELIKTLDADTIIPAHKVLSEDLSKEYQKKFEHYREILNINFYRNRSGKLQFCSSPDLINNEWLKSKYRFANTTAELDQFESLLGQLNLVYLLPRINEQQQYQILHLTRETLRMRNKVITVVDKNRKKTSTAFKPPITVYHSTLKIEVEFIPVFQNTNTRIAGAQVYAIKPAHFFNCETCLDCFFPDNHCDLNTLIADSPFDVIKMEPGLKINPGSYYIFVTENDFEVERVIYYESRTLEMKDAGSVILLKAKG